VAIIGETETGRTSTAVELADGAPVEVVECGEVETGRTHEALRRQAERARERRIAGENLASREIRHFPK